MDETSRRAAAPRETKRGGLHWLRLQKHFRVHLEMLRDLWHTGLGLAGQETNDAKRADFLVREDLRSRLRMHPRIIAHEIDVAVSGGRAVLGGVVSNRHSKRLAAEIAEMTLGVEEVKNEIQFAVARVAPTAVPPAPKMTPRRSRPPTALRSTHAL